MHPPRDDVSWFRKLVSPSGLAFVLLCLFLPFVGLSCEGGLGTLEIRVSGWDMVVNGEPSIAGTGMFDRNGGDTSGLPERVSEETGRDGAGVQPLMLAGVVAILAGVVAGTTLRSAFPRAMAGLAASVVAVLLIGVNEIVVLSTITDEIASDSEWLARDAEAGTRFGFWVTLGLLAAVVVDNVVELVLSKRRPRPATGAWPPPPGPGQPPQQQQQPPQPPPWGGQPPQPYPGPPPNQAPPPGPPQPPPNQGPGQYPPQQYPPSQ
ncbi:hypothetical protein FHX37_4468 [Haloactinospora alba]|uniref:Uncharacterized protein n=1 Tax=Haloactinospora alba TaxID=405555 RepID=A0A543N7D3_9ACTN|nr:hypothetical protein [Haloactinospora alba]TQN27739.1 hypothetical protein FHX37_4468 [Haloactinospora alba]